VFVEQNAEIIPLLFRMSSMTDEGEGPYVHLLWGIGVARGAKEAMDPQIFRIYIQFVL